MSHTEEIKKIVQLISKLKDTKIQIGKVSQQSRQFENVSLLKSKYKKNNIRKD